MSGCCRIQLDFRNGFADETKKLPSNVSTLVVTSHLGLFEDPNYVLLSIISLPPVANNICHKSDKSKPNLIILSLISSDGISLHRSS